VIPDAARLTRDLETGLQRVSTMAIAAVWDNSPRRGFFKISHDSVSAEAIYEQEMLSRSLKAGDIKPVPLDCKSGWKRRFIGQFVA